MIMKLHHDANTSAHLTGPGFADKAGQQIADHLRVGEQPLVAVVVVGHLEVFAFRLSPFAFRLSPFAFRLSQPAQA